MNLCIAYVYCLLTSIQCLYLQGVVTPTTLVASVCHIALGKMSGNFMSVPTTKSPLDSDTFTGDTFSE